MWQILQINYEFETFYISITMKHFLSPDTLILGYSVSMQLFLNCEILEQAFQSGVQTHNPRVIFSRQLVNLCPSHLKSPVIPKSTNSPHASMNNEGGNKNMSSDIKMYPAPVMCLFHFMLKECASSEEMFCCEVLGAERSKRNSTYCGPQVSSV